MKILLFDIETTPLLGYTWGKYEQDVISFVKENHLLCFAYKWLGERAVHAYSLPDFPGYKKDRENDRQLVQKLWDLFDEADAVIAHNGIDFDIKVANAFFARHGLRPPKPFKSIDTKREAKKRFRFNSNKLDDLGNYLGLGRKIDTGGIALWYGCMAGDASAWRKMVAYNKQDVVLLEKVYLKLRPWMETHPNLNVLEGRRDACPNCGGGHLQARGWNISRVARARRFQCRDCGAWSTGKREKREVTVS